MTQPMTDSQREPSAAAPTVEEVAVIAARTIGVSWTALFLAHGIVGALPSVQRNGASR